MPTNASDDVFVAHCKVYLVRYCFHELEEVAAADTTADASSKAIRILIDVELFCSQGKSLQEQLCRKPYESLLLFRKALESLVHVMARKPPGPYRFLLSSHHVNANFNRHCDDHCSMLGCLVTYRGVVSKISQVRLIQYRRDFVCKRCGSKFTNEASFDHAYRFLPPNKCPSAVCSSTQFEDATEPGAPSLQWCRRYQEVRLQNMTSFSSAGTLSESMLVILEDDLVENCWLGEMILVTGILSRRCHALKKLQEPLFDMVIRATNVLATSNTCHVQPSAESLNKFERFWSAWEREPLTGRNVIVASFCPTIFHMFLAKLATLLVIIGGVSRSNESGTLLRGDSHLLLIGDPGTGKSQLLKFASRVAPKSVYTTGIGTTNAGLTCYAVKEEGEWQLEAGALPLAGGGICCIDEFNTMKENDMDALREAMEQQTVSVAKAGLVTKLNCQCSVIAACNFQEDGVHGSVISSPLVSRFDLVLCLKQPDARQWTRDVCTRLLHGQTVRSRDKKQVDIISPSSLWDTDKLKEYLNIVRTLEPTVSVEAEHVLSQYFLKQRTKVDRDSGMTTMRLLDSLIRLSQAHARLMFRTVVTVQDAVVAASLVDLSLKDYSLLEEVDIFQSVFPENPESDFLSLQSAMLSALGLQDSLFHGQQMTRIQQKLKQFRYVPRDDQC